MGQTLLHPIMRSALLAAGRAYARAHRMPLRGVSHKVYGDSRFFENLARRPKTAVTSIKFDDLMKHFHNPKNWPGERVPAAVIDIFDAPRKPACITQFEKAAKP